MNLAALAILGTEELARLALSGKIRARHVWLACDGAKKFREAVARGDVAGDAEARRRAGVCGVCEAMSTTGSLIPGVKKCWCGQALAVPPLPGTCSCLVAVTVLGRRFAGGKTVVGSEGCPRGKW